MYFLNVLCCFPQQFDAVLAAIEDGKPVDLSQMPPPPSSKYMYKGRCRCAGIFNLRFYETSEA